jgi:hypothetical protein
VSIAAACSLALGIGASTAVFSLIDSLLLRQLPVQNPEKLVSVSTGPQQSQRVFSFATWEAMRGSAAFDQALAYRRHHDCASWSRRKARWPMRCG